MVSTCAAAKLKDLQVVTNPTGNQSESPISSPAISDGDPGPRGVQAHAVSRARLAGRSSYSDVVAATNCDTGPSQETSLSTLSVDKAVPVAHSSARPGPCQNLKNTQDPDGWVMPRKTRSLEDMCRKNTTWGLRFKVPKDYLSAEQTNAVRLAEARLTPAQRNAIKLRNEAVISNENEGSPSDSETSELDSDSPERIPAELKCKGKVTARDKSDNLSDLQIDMAAQKAAYKAYSNAKKGVGLSGTQPSASRAEKNPQINMPEASSSGEDLPKKKYFIKGRKNKASKRDLESDSPSDADDESDEVPRRKKKLSSTRKSRGKIIHPKDLSPLLDKRLKDTLKPGKVTQLKSIGKNAE
ncbi:hypothetical protein L218DRAFT_1082573 [Marasmius fiardii PR-910]|nr:hypothetical protein L218DRAFT_1082573 [Marasmius fiardii PR-910]